MAAAHHEEVICVDELPAHRRVVTRKAGQENNSNDMLSVVIQVNDIEWLNFIMTTGDKSPANNQQKKPKIQRVPRLLRNIESNTKCYEPLVVSIGPYHHGKPELGLMEKHKKSMARQYVESIYGKPIDALYKEVVKVAKEARECYAECPTKIFDDEAFTRMMFLDGCFILQFVDCIGKNKRPGDMKSHQIAFVQRDLFLLENQLPFIVLKQLMRLRYKNIDEAIDLMTINYIKQTRITAPRKPNTIYDPPPVHILELLRTILLSDKEEPNSSSKMEEEPNSSSKMNWSSYRSAKELKEFGIHIKPSKTTCFSDVKYESKLLSGVLTLPPFAVDDSTKSWLLNLAAYETCPDAPDDFAVTSFVCFMDSLIDQAEDVSELRSRGVLLNCLGSDQHVADLFNEIANHLVPNPNTYDHVKGQIKRHYENKKKIWIAEFMHTHFSSPWTVVAFFAAILVIALTIVQTIFTLFPR